MFHTVPASNSNIVGNVQNSEIITEDHQFIVPTKGVKLTDDMRLWEKSEAYFEYIGFILAMNEAVTGRPNSLGTTSVSPIISKLLILLDKLDTMIDETPPIQQPQRFGNQAFRTWYQQLKNNSFTILQEVLPEALHRAIPEIMYYLIEGFGNATRIDYGTGHELSFLMFLCSLFKIGVLVETDKPAIPCKVFARYLDIVRKLQQTYRMEPAGSHGVWSLDDYQFVPFIWGSSQLIAHPRIEPVSFLQQDIIDMYSREYLFLGCIQYINTVKTGPFAEHSNQLWGISGVASWSKVNSGLIKMYRNEVLAKFPVVQHILFGSLFTLKSAPPTVCKRKTRMSITPSGSARSVPSGISETTMSEKSSSQVITVESSNMSNSINASSTSETP